MADPSALDARLAPLLAQGDLGGAATLLLQAYGPEVRGYLLALLGDDGLADDAWSRFQEELWKGLPGFRQGCPARGWVYRVAWSCGLRLATEPARRRGRRLETGEASRLPAAPRTSTETALRAETRAWLEHTRATLSPEEQTLLILRVDRELSWREVAEVLAGDGDRPEEAALRKRFDRLKRKLRESAVDAGLLTAPRG